MDLISTSVTCTFLNQEESSTKTCSITYYQSDSCGLDELPSLPIKQSAQNVSNTITIGIPFINQLRGDDGAYCFIVSANNGTHAATVQGTLNRGIIILLYITKLIYSGSCYPTLTGNVDLCDSTITIINCDSVVHEFAFPAKVGYNIVKRNGINHVRQATNNLKVGYNIVKRNGINHVRQTTNNLKVGYNIVKRNGINHVRQATIIITL